MTGAANIESPRLEVTYEQLSPGIHAAVERIVSQRGAGLFRVDGVGLEDFPTIQQVLVAAQGSHLPLHMHDEKCNYVALSRTPVVEERHAKVLASESFNEPGEKKELWLRVPGSMDETKPEVTGSRQRLSDKQFFLAVGGTGLAADVMFMAGLASEKPGFFVGFLALAGPMTVAGIRRIRNGTQTVESQS